VETGELEQARLLTWEVTEEREALDRFALQTLQGAETLRRWLWTVILVALALLVIAFFPPPT
jgi:hypothetical protein